MAEQFLRFPEVLRLVGFRRTKCTKMIEAGTFPPPIHVRGIKLWVLSEVEAWQQDMISRRNAGDPVVTMSTQGRHWRNAPQAPARRRLRQTEKPAA